MADRSERTGEEREAARREREAARREGGARDGARRDGGRRDRVPRDGATAAASAPRPAKGPRLRRPGRGLPGRDGGQQPYSLRRRVIAVLALVLAVVIVWFLVELFQPFHGSGSGSVVVVIPPHSSAGAVGDKLAREGVIDSSFFFQLRATVDGERGDLRAGIYHLKRGMTYGAVLAILTKAPPPVPVTELTTIPGRTRRQLDSLLKAQGVSGSYYAATRSSPLLNPAAYGAPRRTDSLEGFLFPDTYQLREPVSIAALVADQLTRFKQEFAGVDLRYARSRHLTPYDVLIVASMIEGEAQTARDRALVSAVIYNRLRLGMPLQIDATTRYATNNYSSPLTAAQLASPSPYNTRIHKGLPPTPIDNPGMAAIQAAAHPANTNYLYFVVEPCGNGAEVFSSNYNEFVRDTQRYQAARAKRGGRSPAQC